MAERSTKKTADPQSAAAQLKSFIDKFDEKDRRLIRAVRAAMRKRLPTANELVWDNYNFFVIGYSPTEKPTDAPLSIGARASGINLFFIHGAKLKDPKKRLEGSGKQTRFIRLPSAEVISEPDVEALIAQALERSEPPMPETGKGKLIIRSVSAKQRPRQKG